MRYYVAVPTGFRYAAAGLAALAVAVIGYRDACA